MQHFFANCLQRFGGSRLAGSACAGGLKRSPGPACHPDVAMLLLAVVSAGLGTEPGSCSIVSGEDNKGDGIVLCGQDPQAAMRERGWNVTAYKVRERLGFRG